MKLRLWPARVTWPRAGSLVLLAALAAGAGLPLHRQAREHVRYYTGDEPRTLDCLSCHVYARGGTLRDRLLRPRYRSPLNIAISADGSRLYVTAQDSDALLVVDARQGRLLEEIGVGRRPNDVVLSADGRTAYVTNEGSDSVSAVDLASRRVTTFAAGDAPTGLALAPDGSALFVANWFGNDISVIDLQDGRERRRLAAGSNPLRVVPSPDGSRIVVANQLSRVAAYPAPPVAEITVLDAPERKVVQRLQVPNAHLLEGMAFSPQDGLALVTLVRPKNLLPAVQVARGWMMTSGLGVVDVARGRVAQVTLDEPDAFYADPNDVVITPDGRYAFVSHSGADCVTVVDLPRLRSLVREASSAELAALPNHLGSSRRFVVKRIAVGANPKGMALSPDGRYVYVAERLADRIGVIDVRVLEITASIDLGGARWQSLVRRGETLFNSARFSFQGQFSCRSCHPGNHSDHLQFDLEPDGLGRNIVDNRTLLGIRDTAPFKWNGRNTSLYMQCGIRFARFLTRVEPLAPGELNALVAFIGSLEQPPNRYRPGDGRLAPAQERGKTVFERAAMRDGAPIPEANRCVTCHSGPRFTNRTKADVGSASPADSEKAFDTPQLSNVYQSAPYLHDGKAATLEEIWTVYSPADTHGVTSDLGKSGLNDLIEYLKTL